MVQQMCWLRCHKRCFIMIMVVDHVYKAVSSGVLQFSALTSEAAEDNKAPSTSYK